MTDKLGTLHQKGQGIAGARETKIRNKTMFDDLKTYLSGTTDLRLEILKPGSSDHGIFNPPSRI